MKNLVLKLVGVICLGTTVVFGSSSSRQWSVDKANEWYSEQAWLVGCNFLPSTAINQIEMWQASTWDCETIERELSMARDLGFNTVRVYLHDLVYKHEGEAFLDRIDEFLSICESKGIKTLLVFFDDCHGAQPKYGKQPELIPGVHNSGWKQSPGYHFNLAYEGGTHSQEGLEELERYVKNVLTRFKDDSRVLGWDLYNEPGHGKNKSLKLLRDTWNWAWDVRPSQPLTACVKGSSLQEAREMNAKNSDIYSFHTYMEPDAFKESVETAIREADGRPVWCTEYMARSTGNTFELCLPIFKEANIACWNWGLVDGKSGTKWPWSSRKLVKGEASPIPTGDPALAPEDPPLWFHDIFRSDGTPYRKAEVEFIKQTIRELR
ncbi:cellulase family glycosylhydrolase [Pelagicoccus mobilis]|uniref:Cellulase family glycosylhydrolase n=1 Tax=Pelagicoccus mobilis TaxID=415221 RepID=A0A934VPW5_9BACT|nr:cellulase family glycosylhydrolase [Pelagicoccus mobilis]MBK1877702.1 cellulase family glycosylhydrolase [Pelagicoccus mobilis]